MQYQPQEPFSYSHCRQPSRWTIPPATRLSKFRLLAPTVWRELISNPAIAALQRYCSFLQGFELELELWTMIDLAPIIDSTSMKLKQFLLQTWTTTIPTATLYSTRSPLFSRIPHTLHTDYVPQLKSQWRKQNKTQHPASMPLPSRHTNVAIPWRNIYRVDPMNKI
jgi:hypothetical protein